MAIFHHFSDDGLNIIKLFHLPVMGDADRPLTVYYKNSNQLNQLCCNFHIESGRAIKSVVAWRHLSGYNMRNQKE